MKLSTLLYFGCAITLLSLLSGCNDENNASSISSTAEIQTGALVVNGAVANIAYMTPSLTGKTDQNGHFKYRADEGTSETVIFYIGNENNKLPLPAVNASNIISLGSWYTQYDNINIPINIKRLLLTLDDDLSSDNGLNLIDTDSLELNTGIPLDYTLDSDSFEISLLLFDALKSLFLNHTGLGQLIEETVASTAFNSYIEPQDSFYDPNDLNLGTTVPLDHTFRVSEFGSDNIATDHTYQLCIDNLLCRDLTNHYNVTKLENTYNTSKETAFDLDLTLGDTQHSITEDDIEIANFTTGAADNPQGHYTNTPEITDYTLEELEQSYEDALNLTLAERALIEPVFPHIANPPYRHRIHSTTLTYTTATPDGELIELSAYVAFPNVDNLLNPLTSEDVKILSYQKYTGENVGKTDSAAQLLGNLAASNNYFVIASYYIGHGATDGDIPAYLIEDAAATFSLDALKAFEEFYNENYTDDTGITIDITSQPTSLFGYSQGGHSTMAVMLRYLYEGYTNLAATWAGEGPYNLLSTMDGMVSRYLDSTDDTYLNYTEYALVPYQVGFLQEYILPSYREYYGLNLDDDDVFIETSFLGNTVYTLKPSFALEYTYTNKYDTLKSQLFKNSLTNMSEISLLFEDTPFDVALNEYMAFKEIDFPIYLYQYEEDVLVTEGNYEDMAALLEQNVINNINSTRGVCEVTEDGIIAALDQKIFDLFTLDPTGTHVICGFYMLNDFIDTF
ncbi:hypothetical protein [uncultured Shewanella sp.]|uniref:alpha/beta hydrolase family protein n=1 Tax=uncultured Shewanella sp. TaxID=173975 RepID=UPI002628C011|nr:hypothetical protein [uncultured Shewanella sp.]